jgi:pyridoxine 5-phosphate synthase
LIRLGVNVDHVATVRQARRVDVPDPVEAALMAERAGADGITVHLREDRRHIQERDVQLLRQRLQTKLNLEMAVTPSMLAFAENLRPDDACFVPEKREELTTEGGLDVVSHRQKIREAAQRLQGRGVRVSLFVHPEPAQIATL